MARPLCSSVPVANRFFSRIVYQIVAIFASGNNAVVRFVHDAVSQSAPRVTLVFFAPDVSLIVALRYFRTTAAKWAR